MPPLFLSVPKIPGDCRTSVSLSVSKKAAQRPIPIPIPTATPIIEAAPHFHVSQGAPRTHGRLFLNRMGRFVGSDPILELAQISNVVQALKEALLGIRIDGKMH